MSTPPVDEKILWHTYITYIQARGSTRQTAKELGLTRDAVSNRLQAFAKLTKIDVHASVLTGNINSFKSIQYPLPKKGKVQRYLVTTAQNNTYVHKPFWENLLAYAKHCKAQIMVNQISYNKSSYAYKAVKPGQEIYTEDLWYDKCLKDYFIRDRIAVAPTLTICGEQNIMPTAARPLSGFQTYPGTNSSAIFPHTTISMESVPVMQGTEVKINYTTGACTARNYIAKKEGLKAEFHHSYGALIVEVDSSGDWWVRQLNAKDDGSFCDLDIEVHKGKVTTGNRVEAINWGDVHIEQVDPVVYKTNWGKGGILDTLKPKYQLMHDTCDFYARNHHISHNPHANFERWREGNSDVRAEFERVRDFLNGDGHRANCTTVVVDSNHDGALVRWLREGEYKTDPVNAVFFLECQTLKYRSMQNQVKNYHLVEEVLRTMGTKPEVKFLREDESFLICKGMIECGQHGHLGPNGARGTANNLSKVGKKANTGHSHTAGILQGLYTAGTCTLLKLEYTKGPSSWSWSHIVTYPSGKRAILTLRKNGKWRA